MAVRLSTEESGSLYGSIQPYSPRTTSSSSNSRSSIRRSWQRWRASRTRNGRERDSTGMRSPTINVANKSESSESSDSSSEEESQASTKRFPSGPKLPSCRQMCSQRVPKGRAFVLIFSLMIAERYILYGAVNQVLSLIPELPSSFQSEGFGSFLKIFLYYCISRLFYPIGGFLADIYLGRYRVIHISLWLYWVAFALLAVASILYQFRAPQTDELYDHILPITAYVLVILASGGFESTIIPFGPDQLEAASSSELSSYFYWHYIALQVGLILNVVINSAVSVWLPAYLDVVHVLVTLLVATLALILHITLEHWYFKNALRENCIKLVSQVLWYVAKVKRHMPQRHRAFRYGEGKMPRIELAKRKYDGKFSGDQVEDVKTFCMISFLLLSLGGYFFSLTGVSKTCIMLNIVLVIRCFYIQGDVMLTYRLNATLFEASQQNSSAVKLVFSNAFYSLNCLIGLLFVPLVNHIFIPCVPSLTIRARMGIGMVINILAVGVAAAIESVGGVAPLHRALWLVLPTILFTLPEVLTFISGKHR